METTSCIPVPALPVLAVDDEPQALHAYRVALRMGGIHQVICCNDSREAMPALLRAEIGVVILDLSMPHRTGHELLVEITHEFPHIPVIVVTSSSVVDTVVSCMRLGAFDYMLKPFEPNRLLTSVFRAFEVAELHRACRRLTANMLNDAVERPEAFAHIVTADPAMRSVFRCIEAIAATSRPVLITGETGTGKELAAQAVHALSGRRGQFVPVNVSGLDDGLFTDTLFGHRRGAFTGADSDHAGLIQSAEHGTLFMDEIGDLSPGAQVKLLRLLQEHEYLPLGSSTSHRTDARIVAATHQDLSALQKAGAFRNDLYYRLQCHHIHLPPLRERRGDIPLLFDHFIREAAITQKKPIPGIESGVLDVLAAYAFPGNVREFESLVFDAVSNLKGANLTAAYFRHRLNVSPESGLTPSAKAVNLPSFENWTRLPGLREVDELLITEALRRCNGNQSAAARMLGVSQPALSKRLKKGGAPEYAFE